ncbi:hypothetical protein ACHAXA_002019 [Cyclostephanos tholiformis]|uniref:Uncharacterized protein n=1 Tax=Cyclostephanos tholiformis TaxID=382380 RepID=A0ABD3SSD1_9STRA
METTRIHHPPWRFFDLMSAVVRRSSTPKSHFPNGGGPPSAIPGDDGRTRARRHDDIVDAYQKTSLVIPNLGDIDDDETVSGGISTKRLRMPPRGGTTTHGGMPSRGGVRHNIARESRITIAVKAKVPVEEEEEVRAAGIRFRPPSPPNGDGGI